MVGETSIAEVQTTAFSTHQSYINLVGSFSSDSDSVVTVKVTQNSGNDAKAQIVRFNKITII